MKQVIVIDIVLEGSLSDGLRLRATAVPVAAMPRMAARRLIYLACVFSAGIGMSMAVVRQGRFA